MSEKDLDRVESDLEKAMAIGGEVSIICQNALKAIRMLRKEKQR